tara:strand:+ start:401 stop:520 length:120 start_codon:yes stop_codon:yes gene_type:complete
MDYLEELQKAIEKVIEEYDLILESWKGENALRDKETYEF